MLSHPHRGKLASESNVPYTIEEATAMIKQMRRELDHLRRSFYYPSSPPEGYEL
jgi:hypothetical protein